MSKTKDVIFVSFSREISQEVASELRSIIHSIYKDRNKVEVFFSPQSLKPGQFVQQIYDKIDEACCGISILSQDNQGNSPWLMFEAGALALSSHLKDITFIPYLFDFPVDNIANPFQGLHCRKYEYVSKNNQDELIKLLIDVNESLSPENRLREMDIRGSVSEVWQEVKDSFHDIARKLKEKTPTGHGDKVTDTDENSLLDLSSLVPEYETREQSWVMLSDSFTPRTPAEIEFKLEHILKTQIPSSWHQQNAQDIKLNNTRVVINGTRLSNFVVFTDGRRVVIFDRNKDPDNTSVINDRFDVFGAVNFENRSMKFKIKSAEFFDAPIQYIEEINGVAIEKNSGKRNEKTETVIMLGVCVYLKPTDLELALNESTKNEIKLISIKELNAQPVSSLTSKAKLGVRHLLSTRNPYVGKQ